MSLDEFGGDPFDVDEPEDDSERCPDCGAWPEEFHAMDCGYDDDDIDAWDCGSPYHPGCKQCEEK